MTGFASVVKEMEEELGTGNKKPEILAKLAQYELTLKDWIEEHRGYSKVCCHCREMLASISDTVRVCAMLCEQPPDRAGNSCIL